MSINRLTLSALLGTQEDGKSWPPMCLTTVVRSLEPFRGLEPVGQEDTNLKVGIFGEGECGVEVVMRRRVREMGHFLLEEGGEKVSSPGKLVSSPPAGGLVWPGKTEGCSIPWVGGVGGKRGLATEWKKIVYIDLHGIN